MGVCISKGGGGQKVNVWGWIYLTGKGQATSPLINRMSSEKRIKTKAADKKPCGGSDF